VELLPAHQVRAFVTGNKDDAADARGLWLAAQHNDIRRVPVKSAQQQAELSVHRLRSHWVSVRTASVNSLRGLLYEFGVALPKGRSTFCTNVAEHRAQIDAKLPEVMQRLLDVHLQALREIDVQIAALESQLKVILRSNDLARRLEQAGGIGLMGSTALAATLGDASGWRNAREFACCLGLTPRHTGTGGKVRIGGISKRGDAYLRTVLIHGARNMIRAANPPQWIAELLKRRPPNVVATAAANKLARIAWSMAAHGEKFDPLRAFGGRALA
jgi:transposase